MKRNDPKQAGVSALSATDGNIHTELLANIEQALRNNPAAAHAFAALMWLVGDAAKGVPKCEKVIAPLVEDSISLAYEHTLDHQADHQEGLERFKRVLAEEFG